MRITHHPKLTPCSKDLRSSGTGKLTTSNARSNPRLLKSKSPTMYSGKAYRRHDEQWENPYEWGEFKVVDDEVHLTTNRDKWFLMTKKEYAILFRS
jgi:hypothetical protein